MIRELLKLYVFLSVIALIQMLILYSYANKINMNYQLLDKISFAGFPYAQPVCNIMPASTLDLHAACDNGTEIIKVHDAGFLPIFHDVHMKDYTRNYRYACSGDVFRKDAHYETDDRFKCDIAFREVFTMQKLS